jgi:hypothetical protein
MSVRNVSTSGKRRLAVVGITTVGVTALVAVLAFAALALHVRPAYGSGSGGGGGGCYNVTTNGPACTFKDHYAYTEFDSFGSDGCSFTDTYIQAFESLTNPGHAAMQQVYVSMTQYDCNGNPVASASNYDPNTGMPDFTGTLTFGSQLTTATANGTATMTDYNTNAQFTSTINVTWKAFGPTTTSIDSFHSRTPGFIMSSHFTGSSRGAEASGTVTDATGTNVVTTPSLYGSLNDDSGGTVQISHT